MLNSKDTRLFLQAACPSSCSFSLEFLIRNRSIRENRFCELRYPTRGNGRHRGPGHNPIEWRAHREIGFNQSLHRTRCEESERRILRQTQRESNPRSLFRSDTPHPLPIPYPSLHTCNIPTMLSTPIDVFHQSVCE